MEERFEEFKKIYMKFVEDVKKHAIKYYAGEENRDNFQELLKDPKIFSAMLDLKFREEEKLKELKIVESSE